MMNLNWVGFGFPAHIVNKEKRLAPKHFSIQLIDLTQINRMCDKETNESDDQRGRELILSKCVAALKLELQEERDKVAKLEAEVASLNGSQKRVGELEEEVDRLKRRFYAVKGDEQAQSWKLLLQLRSVNSEMQYWRECYERLEEALDKCGLDLCDLDLDSEGEDGGSEKERIGTTTTNYREEEEEDGEKEKEKEADRLLL